MTNNASTQGKQYRLTVNVIIRRPDGNILLLKRSTNSQVNPGRWDLPGGKAEACEEFHQTLFREVEEETGLGIIISGFAGATELTINGLPIIFLIMEAELRSGEVNLSNEHDEFLWTDPGSVLDLDLCEQFRDILQVDSGRRTSGLS